MYNSDLQLRLGGLEKGKIKRQVLTGKEDSNGLMCYVCNWVCICKRLTQTLMDKVGWSYQTRPT